MILQAFHDLSLGILLGGDRRTITAAVTLATAAGGFPKDFNSVRLAYQGEKVIGNFNAKLYLITRKYQGSLPLSLPPSHPPSHPPSLPPTLPPSLPPSPIDLFRLVHAFLSNVEKLRERKASLFYIKEESLGTRLKV